jgi:hypothetical protein
LAARIPHPTHVLITDPGALESAVRVTACP